LECPRGEPISEYDHGLGGSITGGLVYRGTAIPELAGWYLFGDFTSGRLFGIREDSAVGIEPEILSQTGLQKTGLQIVSFGQDADGEIYVLNFIGTIHQVVDAP